MKFPIQKKLVKKTKYVKASSSSAITYIGYNSDIGLNADKVVIPPFVEYFSSIPNSSQFIYSVYWEYKNILVFVANVAQAYTFYLTWYETE